MRFFRRLRRNGRSGYVVSVPPAVVDALGLDLDDLVAVKVELPTEEERVRHQTKRRAK